MVRHSNVYCFHERNLIHLTYHGSLQNNGKPLQPRGHQLVPNRPILSRINIRFIGIRLCGYNTALINTDKNSEGLEPERLWNANIDNFQSNTINAMDVLYFASFRVGRLH